MFNRKAVEAVSTAVSKNLPGQSKPQQQRARTASMPAENRKVRHEVGEIDAGSRQIHK